MINSASRPLSARSLFLLLVSLCTLNGLTWGQSSVPDAAIPVSVTPVRDSVQFFGLNKDRTLLGADASKSSTYSLLCPAPAGLSGPLSGAAPIAFNEGPRFLFETGIGATGTNAIVGVGAEFSGTSCLNTPALAFYGTSVSLIASDRRNKRVTVISTNGSGSPDVITNISTSNAGSYFAPGTLFKQGQVSLDSGGTYSALVPDVDGTVGYTAITQVRTDTSTGNLWIYDPTFNRALKVLGPGGVPLPAVNAFIIHNPNMTGGGLLVLTNQDLLTSTNLGAPPLVTTPFTLIDMGLLGNLLQSHPTSQSVTLPYVMTIKTNLSYYAIFGSAFNPADNKFYLLVGTGTSTTNLIRQVIRYDPANPTAPAETVIADISSVPLYPGGLPQIALNAASGSMQILTNAPNTVYTVNITGTGDTAVTVAGTTFGDTAFDPVAISTNPLLGETYIASNSGKVDVLLRPSSIKPRATINLNGPLSAPTAGQSTSLQVESVFPLPDAALNTTPITITATAQSTGASFTFASPNTSGTLSPTRYISGTFPTDDIYTVVASFPGDATYAAFSAPSVTVAVGVPRYQTSIAVVASSSSQTAGTATVTLSGTTYTPTGTITIQDGSTKIPLTTSTLLVGRFANPISINFTFPSGTSSILAVYSGDSNNSTSTSAVTTIPVAVVKSDTSLALTGPTTNPPPNTAFNVTIALTSVNGNLPTGSVILNATPAGSSASQIASVSASQAFASGGTTIAVTLPGGNFSLQANYPGDANFNASNSSAVSVTVSASTTPAVTLSSTALTFTGVTGTTSAYQNVVLTNTGGGALNIASIVASNSAFAQVNGCPGSLAAGTNCTIRVNFTPASGGTYRGAVTITDNAPGSPHIIALTGSSPIGVATPDKLTVNFDDQTVGTSSLKRPVITLTNAGTGPLHLLGPMIDQTSNFEVLATDCTDVTLQPGASCKASFVFHPSTGFPQSKTFVFVATNAPDSATITLTGNGLARGACKDIDGDGLCDDWELNGVLIHTAGKPDAFIDLPTMGAKYDHKDVFVQVDYMETASGVAGEHTHKMKLESQANVIQAFDHSPVTNVDGTTGIHVHIDCGSTCIMDPVSKTTWGTLSKAVSLPEQSVLDPSIDGKVGTFTWTRFDQNSLSFNASGRSIIFHHSIFAHDQKAGVTNAGISRNGNDAAFFNGASDYIVSLGSWANSTGTAFNQARSFMHELGHNLGLAHGGRDQDNGKPNYLSIMNYNTVGVGIIVDGVNGYIDYSRQNLPRLDEFHLDERVGLNVTATQYPATVHAPSIDHYGLVWYCQGANMTVDSPKQQNSVNGNTNWDCDKKGVISPQVAVDINLDAVGSTLAGAEDWSVLKFTGGAVSGLDSGFAPPTVTPQVEFNFEQNTAVIPFYSVEVYGPGALHTAPGSSTTLRFSIANRGQRDDTYNLSAIAAGAWVIAPGFPATISIVAGSSAEVSVTYTVPATAVDGDNDVLTLRVASQNAQPIVDTVEVRVYAAPTPKPLAISSAQASFGSGSVGGTARQQVPVVLTNTGISALTLSSASTSAEFSQTNNCGTSLATGASCTITLSFTPAALGIRTGTLTLVSSNGTDVIQLQGTGQPAPLDRPEVAFSATPTATSTGQLVTLSATISGSSGLPPTGTLTFLNGSSSLGQTTLDSSGKASFSSSTLSAGTYALVASYSGDSRFFSTNGPIQQITIVTAVATTTTLGTSLSPAAPGSSVTFTATVSPVSGTAKPTGSIQFLDGSTVLATSTLDVSGKATFATSTLSTSTHTISAVYAGDTVFAASASTPLTEVVGFTPTTTTLTTSSGTVVTGASVTLSVAVSAASGTPTGSVTFLDGTSTLATVALNTTGAATYTSSALAIGTHSFTAQYVAAGIYSASISTAKQVVVTGVPDFGISVTPASLTITRGSTGTATFNVTPINGYSGAIKFSCGTLPQYASCSFSAPQLAFTAASSTAQSSVLTVSTTSQGQAMLRQSGRNSGGVSLASLLGLPALLGGFGLLGWRRKLGIRLLSLNMVLLVFGLLGATVLSGCGGSSGTNQTAVGSYTVTVTVTDSTTNHSVNLPVTVN